MLLTFIFVNTKVSNFHIKLTSRNHEEMFWNFSLPNDNFFRLVHLEIGLFNHELYKPLILLENGILENDILKDELYDLILDAGHKTFDELVLIFQTLLLFLGVLKETNDFNLKIVGYFHILHGRVDSVTLLLKGISFFVQVLDQNCHISQNVGIYDCSKGLSQEYEKDLQVRYWIDIIASHKQGRRVY